jgi:hypothetical protein
MIRNRRWRRAMLRPLNQQLKTLGSPLRCRANKRDIRVLQAISAMLRHVPEIFRGGFDFFAAKPEEATDGQ